MNIKSALAAVHNRIRLAEIKYHREQGAVKLIAVSKTKPISLINLAIAEGQTAFGENYVQEAIDKMAQLSTKKLDWHFLGPIQSNKTRIIAANVDWVHSVERWKIAQRLSEQRPNSLPDLNICLQVNISQEVSKSGIALSELNELVEKVLDLPNISLRGLMVIPQKSEKIELQREPFLALRKVKEDIEQQFNIQLDTLSMGMSADLEAAIAEGATHVRIGTDIFGARN